jgi:hypothetical protein
VNHETQFSHARCGYDRGTDTQRITSGRLIEAGNSRCHVNDNVARICKVFRRAARALPSALGQCQSARWPRPGRGRATRNAEAQGH